MYKTRKIISGLSALCLALSLAGCGTLGGSVESGDTSHTGLSGGAAGVTSVGANSSLERCPQTLGTLAIDSSRAQNSQIELMLQLAVQQSNCFIITTQGDDYTKGRIGAITNSQRNGDYRTDSRQQKGQQITADYFIKPVVTTNRIANNPGSSWCSLCTLTDVLSGALVTNTSQVTLTLYDIRSAVQLSMSEGHSSAKKSDVTKRTIDGSLGGFAQTPEGMATATAFTNAYNTLVISLRNYQAQEVKGGSGRGGTINVN